jgi:hypothetical protein
VRASSWTRRRLASCVRHAQRPLAGRRTDVRTPRDFDDSAVEVQMLYGMAIR